MNNLRIEKIIHILPIVLPIFLSVGCLRESRNDCSDGIILKFKYVNSIGQEARAFSSEADCISVFVFDDNGLYICKKSDSSIQINDSYTMQLPFYSGQYQFVAWAGLSDCYELTPCIPRQTNIQDFTLQLKRDNNHNFSFPVSLLYHGHHDLITLDPSQTKVITIGLQQITNTIRVIIHNADPDTQISIEDNNGYYNYKGEILPDDLLNYIPNATHTIPSSNTYIAEFNTMRLKTDSEARLKIYTPSGELKYDEKLINGLLGANPDINLDTDHNFTVEITFNSYYVPISILINGWEIISEEVI